MERKKTAEDSLSSLGRNRNGGLEIVGYMKGGGADNITHPVWEKSRKGKNA